MDKKTTQKKKQDSEEEDKYHITKFILYSAEITDEMKRESNAKRTVIDKETGKAKEVDIYDRVEKKKNVDGGKSRFSSELEQAQMPSTIRNFISN
jgi:hypothetical protein